MNRNLQNMLVGIRRWVNDKVAIKVESETIKTIWSGTQAEYDAITTKSDNILYIIK